MHSSFSVATLFPLDLIKQCYSPVCVRDLYIHSNLSSAQFIMFSERLKKYLLVVRDRSQ